MAEMNKFNELKHEVLRHGGFYVNFYFDMHSSNPNTIQDLMVGFVGKLTNEKGVKMAVAEVDEAMEREGVFSSTAKVSMLVENFETLIRLTMSYTPIAVDIEEPMDVKIDAGELQQALIAISATNQELTHHILTKSMSPEERKRFETQMANKALMGRKMIERAKEEEEKRNKKKEEGK